MILKILQDGDPILRLIAPEVVEFPVELAELARDMTETMHAAKGIGIAAPQVGRSLRVIVTGLDGPKAPAIVMVNPYITRAQDWQRSLEGCLSVPKERWGQAVSRRKRIVVHYRNLAGEPKTLKAHTLHAACIQHEIDHLNGILFTDYVHPLRQPPPG